MGLVLVGAHGVGVGVGAEDVRGALRGQAEFCGDGVEHVWVGDIQAVREVGGDEGLFDGGGRGDGGIGRLGCEVLPRGVHEAVRGEGIAGLGDLPVEGEADGLGATGDVALAGFGLLADGAILLGYHVDDIAS